MAKILAPVNSHMDAKTLQENAAKIMTTTIRAYENRTKKIPMIRHMQHNNNKD